MLEAFPLISLGRFSAKNGSDLSQYATLYKPIHLLKFTDTRIGDFSQKSKNFCFLPNCQEMLGACPQIGLNRLPAKNGPDLSQYATL
jgi:hypothetical protein